MTLDAKTILGFNATLCAQQASINMDLDGVINVNVTTCSTAVSNNALLNEDGVTPILNEDLNEILVE